MEYSTITIHKQSRSGVESGILGRFDVSLLRECQKHHNLLSLVISLVIVRVTHRVHTSQLTPRVGEMEPWSLGQFSKSVSQSDK